MSPVSSVEQALANCLSTTQWAIGMCGQFCAAMYGYGASGYISALVQWQQTPDALRHPGSYDAPPGGLYFWGGGSQGHGHVAIADGLGGCFSIDISGPGTVTRVPVDTIGNRWGLPYLGWTVPYFQGAQWSAANMIYGVDVSTYQPINFALTTPSDNKPVDFAIIKVTEGTGWLSSKWTGQQMWSRDHGLATGYYHFGRPGNMIAQADYFLGQLGNLAPGESLWFDWEDAGITSAQKDQWIKYVQSKRPGFRVGLYCNTDFWKNRDTSSFAGDGLWIATGGYPAGQPPIASAWLIHQYSTAGNYDHDIAQFADRAAMIEWAGGDVALSDADKTWITNTIKAQTDAAVKARIASDIYGAVWNTDKVRSPDDAPANPTWAAASYLREMYNRVLETKAQAEANGSGLTAANASLKALSDLLVGIKTELDALDLSQVPAEIAAKIEALKLVVTVTEGP